VIPDAFREPVTEMLDIVTEPVLAPPDCLMCVTVIMWMTDGWAEDAPEPVPDFRARAAEPLVKLGSASAAPMPFCRLCSGVFMQMLSQLKQEQAARDGQAGEMTVTPGRIAAPVRPGILLPGQPGFKVR
jgi:hypothetical protein